MSTTNTEPLLHGAESTTTTQHCQVARRHLLFGSVGAALLVLTGVAIASKIEAQKVMQVTAPYETDLPNLAMGNSSKIDPGVNNLSGKFNDLVPLSLASSMRDSNFLYLYDQIDKYSLTPPKVHQHLIEGSQHFKYRNPSLSAVFANSATWFQSSSVDVGREAVRLWSADGGHKMYHLVQEALIDDNYEKLQYWIWFIRATNLWIVGHPGSSRMVTWRGSKVSESQVAKLHEGVIYRAPLYLATSLHESVSHNFKSTYQVKFNIPAYSLNACPMRDLSQFPGEEEVLLPPYTRLLLKRKDTVKKFLEYDVLDGMVGDEQEPIDVPAKS